VFVHGAWAEATGFDGSIQALRDRGFGVIGAANPLRHLTGDTASLAALLGTISDPLCWSATPTAAASHASMVLQPEAVKRLILNAVEETSRSQP
jgi:hypothetical protein